MSDEDEPVEFDAWALEQALNKAGPYIKEGRNEPFDYGQLRFLEIYEDELMKQLKSGVKLEGTAIERAQRRWHME